MRTIRMFCEDCQEMVTVYGGFDMCGDPVIEDADDHDDHDLSLPGAWV